MIRRLGRARAYQVPVSELELSQRATEALLHHDLPTVGALSWLSSEDLLRVLDFDGDIIPKVLGAIAWFCEASGVAEVHVVQCDIEVTDDRWIEPIDLNEYRVAGFGSSDMGPGMNHLAQDTDVVAALVITDGYIDYPAEPLPYSVLWCLAGSYNQYDTNFSPPDGQVVRMHLD